MKQNILFYLIALLFFPLYEMQAAHQPEFSTAGFYELANSGREVYSMDVSTIKARYGTANISLRQMNWKAKNFSCISKLSWGKAKFS